MCMCIDYMEYQINFTANQINVFDTVKRVDKIMKVNETKADYTYKLNKKSISSRYGIDTLYRFFNDSKNNDYFMSIYCMKIIEHVMKNGKTL